VCNRQIRWEFLLNHALALDADFMATGHYVRRRTTDDGRFELQKGIDPAKDQSYVLHVLTQEKLARALFPVGEYSKPKVRELAAAFDLPTATSTDSQDLCFLAGEDYRKFLRRNAPGIGQPGPIQTRGGQTLGEHQGLAYYTIGQRKGLGLASPVPLYVLGKDTRRNTLIVGTVDELGCSSLVAEGVNWISGESPAGPFRAGIKTRYTAKEASGTVTPLGQEKASVHFDIPQRDITPGQAAVFYNGQVLLGGGIIDQAAYSQSMI
jgi:tRNA-specific 2-thiouridylase